MFKRLKNLILYKLFNKGYYFKIAVHIDEETLVKYIKNTPWDSEYRKNKKVQRRVAKKGLYLYVQDCINKVDMNSFMGEENERIKVRGAIERKSHGF